MILDELRTGSEVSIFIRGFASPVANTAYNINLTKRRISSLINYFKEVDNGVFKKYLETHRWLKRSFHLHMPHLENMPQTRTLAMMW